MSSRKPPPVTGCYPGTLAVYNKNLGYWLTAHPHSPLFSTLSMVATHFHNGTAWEAVTSSRDVIAPATQDSKSVTALVVIKDPT